jgi:hypothetical protein
MSSQAQVAANQANAQLSSGPKTPEGKAKSSRNALKTGLTGHTVLLPTDDAERYEAHLLSYADRFDPQTDRETELVQSLADCRWRVGRIYGLETALHARGHIEFNQMFEGYDEKQRAMLIAGETYSRYIKEFRNLELQEQRLIRRADRDEELLKTIQAQRLQEEESKRMLAARLYLVAKKENKPFNPAEFGFEFSIADIEAYLKGVEARRAAEQMKFAS